MTVGKDVSSSVFWRSMKTVQRWRQKRQAIPDSRRSHSEDSIADCFQSGTPDDQFVTRERVKLADWRNDGCCVSVAELQNSWIQSATGESSWTCRCPEIFPDRERTLQAWQYLRRQKMDHLGWGDADGLKHHQSTSVLAAFSCKRLNAIHLSTSLMHAVTLFCRAWVSSGEQKPYICVSSA